MRSQVGTQSGDRVAGRVSGAVWPVSGRSAHGCGGVDVWGPSYPTSLPRMGNPITGPGGRRALKRALAAVGEPFERRRTPEGTTLLIYHRVGGGTPDERDLSLPAFEAQVAVLAGHRVVSLDTALEELAVGDDSPKVVVTFDDGFQDVHTVAWPLLRAAGLPFTLYVTTAYLDGTMHWPGSTSRHPGPALSWRQLEELAGDPLVTIGNHTHTHAPPERLEAGELDTCTSLLESRLGVTPRHFAYTWGVPVPAARQLLEERFVSAATGAIGRNHPDTDRLGLRRVPVRGSDPLAFFRCKLRGELGPERRYERLVRTAKRLRLTG